MKTVLITGAGKGLGKYLAICFGWSGFDIILHGRDKKRLQTIKNRLPDNINCKIVSGDLQEIKTINRLARIAKKKEIDILINNAGIYAHKSFQEMNTQEIRNIIEINLIAPILLTRQIYPIFKTKQSGLIININSMAGKIPNEMEAVYCASKHGLRGFSQSFQEEADKDNVRIISVYLGAMQTEMTKDREDYSKLMKPEEVADMIFNLTRDYQTSRITEVYISRKKG